MISTAGVLLSHNMPDSPLDIGVRIGLDKSVDGSNTAWLVVSVSVAVAMALVERLVLSHYWQGRPRVDGDEGRRAVRGTALTAQGL